MSRKILLVFTLLLVLTQAACWEEPPEGTVSVKTMYGNIEKIIRSKDGAPYHNWWGDDYYPLDLRAHTDEIKGIAASTKDNAAFYMTVVVTYSVEDNDHVILAYVRKFGLDKDTRESNRWKILNSQVNTEFKNAASQYDAYAFMENQERIQNDLKNRLTEIFKAQMFLTLESVQLLGRPDFVNDDIENAASRVVANQKLKEASLAGLEADKIEAERKQVQAATYANPVLLEIRKLELQKDIAEAWSKHQGALVFGSPSGLQISGSK